MESYSIKTLEAYYGFERAVALEEANPARGRLEYALALGLRDDESLADGPVVRDTTGTIASRRGRCGIGSRGCARRRSRGGATSPAPRRRSPGRGGGREDAGPEVRELMEGLLDGVPEEREERTAEQHIRWLAAHLLEWHRREDKSAWWDYFRLRELSVDELVEETKPLAGLEYVGDRRDGEDVRPPPVPVPAAGASAGGGEAGRRSRDAEKNAQPCRRSTTRRASST